MMEETQRLEYRFTVSPSDAMPMVKSTNDRAVGNAISNFAVACSAAVVFYILSENLKQFENMFSILSGMTLVAAISVLISALFRNREKLPDFEPYELEIVASRNGLTLLTNISLVEVGWPAVGKIFADDFGIHIRIGEAEWFVPRSAFPSKEAMQRECERLDDYRTTMMSGDFESDYTGEAMPGTLH